MHTPRYILCLLLCLFVLTSCSDNFLESGGGTLKPTLTPKYLNVENLKFSIPSAGGEVPMKVLSIGINWEIKNGIDWIKLSDTQGNTSSSITMDVSNNPSADNRVGVLYVNSTTEGYTMSIPLAVNQQGANPVLTVSQENVSFTGAASEKNITITSNTDWNAISTASWITCKKIDNTLTIQATPNMGESTRTAVVNINYHKGLQCHSIRVMQTPAQISASTETLSFGQAASKVGIDVQSETEWTASSSNSWIEVSPTTGTAGASKLSISVAPNLSQAERSGRVVLTIGGSQRIAIPIKQKGIYLNASQTDIHAESTGNDKYSLDITSNVNWIVQSCPSWIVPNITEGKNDHTLQLNIADNPSIHERIGQIIIACPGTTLNETIRVQQDGKHFDVNEAKLNFSDRATTQNIEISSDGTWKAESDNDWIHLSLVNATGNATLGVSVDENYDCEWRNGNIHLSMAEKAIDIPVSQTCKYIAISDDSHEISSHNSTINVTITSNTAWKAIADNDAGKWIGMTPSEGEGNSPMAVNVADNASMSARSGTISIMAAKPSQFESYLFVSQAARFLQVNTEQLTFYSKGGISEPIAFHTDGKVSISTDKNWLSVTTMPADSCFTISAQANPSDEVRTGNVIVKLSDLKVGAYELRIPAIQTFHGGSFLRTDFSSDNDYNQDYRSGAGLTIESFGKDISYGNGSQPNLQLNIVGYGNDANYGSEASPNRLTLTITRFQSDKDWNSQSTPQLSVIRTGYEADGEWNHTGGVDGTLDHSHFGNDKDWKENGNKDATINKSNFNDDNNWNE